MKNKPTKKQIIKDREARALAVEIMKFNYEGVKVRELNFIIDGFKQRILECCKC